MVDVDPTAPETPVPPDPKKQQNARLWAMLCHLAAFLGGAFPFGHIAGPLIIWIIKKDEFPEVDAHGKESLNFQISLTIYMLIASLSMLILIGFVLLPALVVFGIVCVIVAALRANEGGFYSYPLTIRFIK